MKNWIFMLLFPAFVFASGNGTIGVPQYLWFGTYSSETFPNSGLGNLPRGNIHTKYFVEELIVNLSNSYPAVNTNWYVKKENSYATMSNYKANTNLDGTEFVMTQGHGNTNKAMLHEYILDTQGYYHTYNDPSQPNGPRAHGGWTRWLFLEHCVTLKNTTNVHYHYDNYFDNGLHAAVGYQSDVWWYRINDCTWWGSCVAYVSEHKFVQFAYKWVDQNKEMKTAWFEANYEDHYQVGGIGVAPAVVANWGFLFNGTQYYNGGTEKVNTVYNEEAPVDIRHDIYHNHVVYGTPYYNGGQ